MTPRLELLERRAPAPVTRRPDSSVLEAALVGRLNADLMLATLLPDGAHVDLAPSGAEAFALVLLMTHRDVAAFGGRVGEVVRYLVLATTLDRAVNRAAARRIDALLEGHALEAPGFVVGPLTREERVRDRAPDWDDPALVWHWGGACYRLEASPIRGTES